MASKKASANTAASRGKVSPKAKLPASKRLILKLPNGEEVEFKGVTVRTHQELATGLIGSPYYFNVGGPSPSEYATVLDHAVETFGSRTNANAWLNKPNRIFNNRSPLQILTLDPPAVEEELVRIDHGMFV
jgi:hypothetical protein